MWEMSAIGYSIFAGHGFGSPWVTPSGPTAWTAPLYPYIVAGVLSIFGVTSAAAFALFTFNSVFSALTCWTVYRIAERVFGRRAAVGSAWVWALYPFAIYWSVEWVWDTTLCTFLLSLLFLWTLEMESDVRLWPWLRYGLVWGLVALSNTSVVAFLPFAGGWLAYRLLRQGKAWLRPAVAGAVMFWAVVSPWIVRDYMVFHKVLFIRGNLGSEFRSGNNPAAAGSWVPEYRVGNDVELFHQYLRVGEVRFSEEQGRLAKQWIHENPKRFLELSCLRVYHFWIGWAQWDTRLFEVAFSALGTLGIIGMFYAVYARVRGAFLFASLLLVYPSLYYFVFTTDRYRHPIEPELVVLAVSVFVGEHVSKRRLGKHREAVVTGAQAAR